MSDNEQQPPTPQLTRRQLRELRNTASNPIIVDPDAMDEASAVGAEPTPAAAPLPRAAEPVEVPPAPVPQASADLGAFALTRRQARLQEKIRTASIPVVTTTGEHAALPEIAESDDSAREATASEAAPTGEVAAHVDTADAADDEDVAEAGEIDVADDAAADEATADEAAADEAMADEAAADEAMAVEAERDEAAPVEVESDEAEPVEVESDEAVAGEDAVDDAVAEEAIVVDETDHEQAVADETVGDHAAGTEEHPPAEAIVEDEPEDEPERHVVSEDLGADLLAGEATATDVPASFDQLLSRSVAATGAFTTPNALILAQHPDDGPLVAPVTATGEVLITGTFSLPENFGSTGVVPGVADGKEVDAVLVDGELPASSSPTPVAASAAISTIKSAEDVIRPPAPEKGSRLMVALAITAGALAVLLAGVLIVALATGVFQ
ncbi:hypothetical protein [Microbacterium arborescens]|uniref:hypothetical protein n=1 Tax=Microbacterium arborescens TaxID=33883 RepID=UPI003C778652